MTTATVTGSLPEIIRNEEGLYEGNLIEYFRILFFKARNLNAPYHNLRHMLHVFYMCHEAIRYMASLGGDYRFSERGARNLLIAALFHDFDHTARSGSDDLNIEYAIRALKANILEEDRDSFEDIAQLIRLTQYPYTILHEDLSELGLVIRDADMSQALNPAWIQQVVFGLAYEWGKTPHEVLRMQGGFHKNLRFYSIWGQHEFPQEVIDAKAKEAEELLTILEK